MGNFKEKVSLIVTPDGEITGELYEGDKIVRKEQMDYASENYINFLKDEEFVKGIRFKDAIMFKRLTPTEYAIAMSLSHYISYGDCILRYNRKILDIKQINELLGDGVGYETLRKTISSLVKKDVLRKVKVQSDTNLSKEKYCYVYNPYICFIGRDIRKSSADMFKDSEWAKEVRIRGKNTKKYVSNIDIM